MISEEHLKAALATAGPGFSNAPPPANLTIQIPQPDPWKLYALRLGTKEFGGGGKLMFEGSFEDCNGFLDWVERIPMNTKGFEAYKEIQNPQVYIMRCVGPLLTVKLTNKKTCLDVNWNDE